MYRFKIYCIFETSANVDIFSRGIESSFLTYISPLKVQMYLYFFLYLQRKVFINKFF